MSATKIQDETKRPNIFPCLESAVEDVEREWYVIFTLACGGSVLCRGKDMPLAHKTFTCGELNPNSEFPIEKLAISCPGIKVDMKICPAFKWLLKVYGMAGRISADKHFAVRGFPLEPGVVNLDLRTGTEVHESHDDLMIRKTDLDGARLKLASNLVEVFMDAKDEIKRCGDRGKNVHGGIIAFFKRLIGGKWYARTGR